MDTAPSEVTDARRAGVTAQDEVGPRGMLMPAPIR